MRILSSGVAALFAAAVCLGFSPVLVHAAATEPVTVAVLRAGLAALMLAPLAGMELRRRGRPPARQLGFAAAGGAALGLDFACWNVSVLEAGAGIATVLLNVQVVLMPLLLLLLDRVRPARSTWVVAPLMLVGVGLSGGLLGSSHGTVPEPRGVLLGVLAGAGYTGYLYLVRRGTVGQDHWPVTVLTLACAVAALASASVGAALGVLEPPSGARAWMLIVLLALVSQVIAFALINRGMVRVTPSVAAPVLLLPSVFALVVAAALLDQIPTLAQLVGCAVILGGAGWTTWRAARGSAGVRARVTSSPGAEPSAARSRACG